MFGSNRRVSGPIEEHGGPPPNEYAPGMPPTKNRTAGYGRAVPSPISQPQQSTPQQATSQQTASQQAPPQQAGQQPAGNPYQQQSGQQSAPYGNAGAEPRMTYPGSLPPPIAGAPRRIGAARGGVIAALVAMLIPLVVLLIVGVAFTTFASRAEFGAESTSPTLQDAPLDTTDGLRVVVASPDGEQEGFTIGELSVDAWTLGGGDGATFDAEPDDVSWYGADTDTTTGLDVTYLGEDGDEIGYQYCAVTLADGEVAYLTCSPDRSSAAPDRVRSVQFDLN